MADINKLIPLIFKWEGGYVNDPVDRGGPTKMGVTLKTWQSQGYDKTGDGIIDLNDLKLITREEVVKIILKPHYWDRWQADRIQNQSIANILVDWVWGSGKYGITIPQGILNVKQDGLVGDKTLHALNTYPDPEELFDKIKQARRAYLNLICLRRPANNRFLKGWLNRLADFNYFLMIGICALFLCLGGCKSIPPETKTHIVSEATTTVDEEVVATSDRQSDRNESKRFTRDSEDTSVSQTVVTEYDTSLSKDTVTGNYPVKSISETIILRGVTVNVSNEEVEQAVVRELFRQTGKRKTLQQNTEEVRQQQSVKDPYRWRYGAIAIIAVVIVALYTIFSRTKHNQQSH